LRASSSANRCISMQPSLPIWVAIPSHVSPSP
jgi:hypothetical protein